MGLLFSGIMLDVSTLSIIDVETTGLSAATHRVIEVGIIRVENNQVVKRYQQLINPEAAIPSFIQNHTGITPQMVKDAPTFAEVFKQIDGLLEGGIFMAHNAGFDYGFIQAEYRRLGRSLLMPRICTVQLSRRLFPQYRHHGLDHIIRRFSIECPARHRALDDAEVVWQFYNRLRQNIAPELLLI